MVLSLRTWVVTLVLASPAPVLAQSSAALFIDAGPMLNQDMTWGGRQVRNAGISVGGGVRIGGRTELRILLERPPSTTLDSSSQDVYNGVPPVVVERVTYRTRALNQTVSAMVGRLFPVGTRHTLTTSFGWSSSRRRGGGVTKTVENVASGAKVETQSASRTYEWGGPVFGFGGIVAVTKRLAVVPEMRLIWYPLAENGNTIVRTAINARWTF